MSDMMSNDDQTDEGGNDLDPELALYTCEDCCGSNMITFTKQEYSYLNCEDCGVKCLND